MFPKVEILYNSYLGLYFFFYIKKIMVYKSTDRFKEWHVIRIHTKKLTFS